MSLLNCYVGKSRALMLADTAVTNTKTHILGYSSKLFPIVHANAVIGSIGLCDPGLLLMQSCLRYPTFDEICEAVLTEELAQKAMQHVESELAKVGTHELSGQALVLVGYSRSLQECIGIYAFRPPSVDTFIVNRFSPSFVVPADPWMNLPFCQGSSDLPDTPDKLVEVAKCQVGSMRGKFPNGRVTGSTFPLAIGGPLTLAEVTKDRVSVSIVDAQS